jgi:hypothetical protein
MSKIILIYFIEQRASILVGCRVIDDTLQIIDFVNKAMHGIALPLLLRWAVGDKTACFEMSSIQLTYENEETIATVINNVIGRE